MSHSRVILHGLAIASLSLTFSDQALAAHVAAAPVVGSGNVAVADPTIPRPSTTPCVVQLFSNDVFNDYATRPFSYAPPTGCKGHWAKVVLEADFSVSPGIQYDRTATIWLGGVNLYFGTTQEPSPDLGPSWHVERDLTDYTALFNKAGQGQADIGNTVNSTYTGVIYGSARLLFYPASSVQPAGRTADAVYPLGSDPVGSTVGLATPADVLSKTLTLPHNVQYAYLDIFAQSQYQDEFWYTCVPTSLAGEVQECGGGDFREVEVDIDGQAAGVAPVYPWIYTGGLSDPLLWEPTPGVQTLNFVPYRVDLSPFAGVLSNGSPHKVALHVAGAANYFSTTASLLVYLDPKSAQNSGTVVVNTLVGQLPSPKNTNSLKTDTSGDVTGDINTKLSRDFTIEGYTDTAYGRVYNQVEQTVSFANQQAFTINANTYRQVTDQTTTAASVSQTLRSGLVTSQFEQSVVYPLHVDFNEVVAGNGDINLISAVNQSYAKNETRSALGSVLYSAQVANAVSTTDNLSFDPNFNYLGHTGQQSSQTFSFADSLGSCFNNSVASANDLVATWTSGTGCTGGTNNVLWYARPDGSPDNFSEKSGL